LDGIGWIIGWKSGNKNRLELDGKSDAMPNTETLNITNEILTLIAELDEFKGAWRALGTLAPERLLSLRKVATIESVGSSTRIEGSKLSDREVEQLLSNLSIKSFASRDEQEVAGYAEVMETIFSSWADIPLTENHLKQLHRDLLKYSDKDERHRGAYKTLANNVEAFGPDGKSLGIVFATASPFHTPRRMSELIEWANQKVTDKSLHPLLIVSVFVVVFLAIHPFQDGNGRLSRALTTLLLLKVAYEYVPYSSLESVIEKTKEGYYLALRRTQGTLETDAPNWQPWITYFLKALQQQKRNLEAKVKRERIVLGALPELSVQILEFVRAHGRITISEAVIATGANRGTLKDHFKTLVENKHLAKHGQARATWYSLS
jgi:Fic family protein